VRSVAPYVPGEQPAGDARIIKLNTNENPYPPSDRVLAALRTELDERLRLYPDPDAGALRQKAATVYGVPIESILVGNGSDELLTLLVRAIVDPGAPVAYPVPTYSLYATLVGLQGARAVELPFADDWTLPAGLAETGAPLTFLCNPNSPSGTVVADADIAALASAVHGVLVVDEAYADFADHTTLTLLDDHPNLVVLRTLSKSFSLAGLRVGLAFGHPELLAGLRTMKDSYNVNRLTLAAATAALSDVEDMRRNVGRVCATRERLSDALRALGYEVPPSRANFVLARRPGVDQAPIVRALAEAGILVRHFPVPRLTDAMRITIGTDDEIDAFLRALRVRISGQAP